MTADPNHFTRSAAHLMWLQRRRTSHQRWQKWLLLSWMISILASSILFGLILPALPLLMRQIIIGGLMIEMLVLGFVTFKVFRQRQTIEAEIALMTKTQEIF